MAAVVQGTTLMITFGSYAYTGFIPETMTVSYPNGNVKVVRGVSGETLTKIYMDPSQSVKGDFIILGATGTIIPPIEGAAVTLTPPTGTSTIYGCISAEVSFSADETKLTLDLIKETSMTYA